MRNIIFLLFLATTIIQAQSVAEITFVYPDETVAIDSSYTPSDQPQKISEYEPYNYTTEPVNDTYSYEADSAMAYYDQYAEQEIIQPTNILLYSPAYKTFNYNRLQTKKIPTLVSSKGMLKNINNSFWNLKFYAHPDVALYNQIDISFKDNVLTIKTIDFTDKILENNKYLLSPIKMFKPNEGIFAYSNKDGQLRFIYMHLLLEYLLAFKIVNSYEEAEEMTQKSLTELGIFTLK